MGVFLQHKWNAIRRRFDTLYIFAMFLVGAGVTVYFMAGNTDWLKGVGGVIAGTGFTVLISTITGKRAVHEQYAKEANLRRKTDVYGPLHAELKKLREALQQARSGQMPYPRNIDLAEDALPDGGIQLPSAYANPTLQWWSVFKQDYRIDDFSPSTRRLLDELLEHARSYNKAVDAILEPTVEVVGAEADLAILATERSAEYKQWLQDYGGTPEYGIPLGHESPQQHSWYRRLQEPAVSGESLGHSWANSWVHSWPYYYQPTTTGWLLAGNAERAARFVEAGFRSGAGQRQAPPLLWIEDIFCEALPKLQSYELYRKASEVQDALFIRLRQVEDEVTRALEDIQERYEGGRPPL